MAFAVDQLVSEFIAKTQGYERDVKRAAAAVDEHTAAIERNNRADAKATAETSTNQTRRTSAEVQAAREQTAIQKQAAKEIAAAAEQSAEASKRAKKSATDSSIADDARSTASATRAAKTKADTEIAEAERSARSRARLNTATYGPPRPINIIEPGTGRPQTFGFGNQSAPVSDRPLPVGRAAAVDAGAAGAKAAAAEATVEREIDHALEDRALLQAGLIGSTREETILIQDQLAKLSLIDTLKRAGRTEAEASIKAEETLAAIEGRRVARAAELAAAQQAQLEKQIAAQSAQVSKGVSLFTGALVGGISLAELQHLTDGYVEFTNALKVAGVDSANFETVQNRLLSVANRNGTSLNALADVYRSLSLASHDVGGSQEQQLKITEAASNALRIQGVSSERARGALLQLGHAFETGRVNAREFNSLALNLYPLLQAAARGSDQFGGSVAKLREAIVGGNVSSKDFFNLILQGADTLQGPASRATLTLAQGFTSLSNALEVYVGGANQANGVSAAVGSGLKTLADNLDTLIPAIAAVGTALTVGYIARMVSATTSTAQFGSAVLGAFGGPVGIAVSAFVLTLGYVAVKTNEARAAAELLNQSIDAQASKFAVVKDAHARAAAETDNLSASERLALTATANLTGEANKLATAWGRVAAQAKAAAIAQAQADVDIANGNVRKAAAALSQNNKSSEAFVRGTSAPVMGVGGFPLESPRSVARVSSTPERETFLKAQAVARDAQAALQDTQKRALTTFRDMTVPVDARSQKALGTLRSTLDGLEKLAGDASGKRLDRINAKIANTKAKIADIEGGASVGAANAAEGGGGVGRGRREPSAETRAKRAEAERQKAVRDDRQFDSALRQAQSDQLSAQADIANDAGERAKIERGRVQASAQQLAKEIASKGPGGTGEFTDAEVFQLQYLNASVANLRIAAVDQAERKRKAEDARNLDAAGLDVQREQLQAQSQLADTLADRRRIALELLDLDYQQREKELRFTADPKNGASKGDREVAQRRLDALPGQKVLDERNANRQFEGAGASYLRGLQLDKPQFVQSEEVKALEAFNAGLDDSVKKALHLHGIFGDIIGDLIDMAIRQAVIKPLAGALFGGGGDSGGSGGGIFGTLIGAIGGLLGGGPSAASQSAAAFSLPGFASGGSGTIGGNPGIDQNLLSLNGKPVARVGRGETLSVSPNTVATNQPVNTSQGGNTTLHQTINIDGSGVNPAGFADGIVLRVRGETLALMAQGQKQTLAAVPSTISRYQQQKG